MIKNIKNIKRGAKSPYFDKNKEPLCLGDDVKFRGKEGHQIRIRDNRWVISPVGVICYFPIEDNNYYADKNGIIKDIEKTNTMTACVGFMCQELVR